MKSIALALLLGSVASVKLNFATGLEEDEMDVKIHMSDGDYNSKKGFEPANFAQAGWVELPICQYENPQYTNYFPRNMKLPDGEIPLADDLSNSGKATCKGYYRSKDADRLNYKTPKYVPPESKQAYDPVIRERQDQIIPNTEHQVTQQEEGHIDKTDGSDGPELKYNQRTNDRDDWRGENNGVAWWDGKGTRPDWNYARPAQPNGSSP